MAELYTSAKWKRKREAILKRDAYRCVECKKYGRITQAVLVHHIKPFEEYPELALDSNNLESLCSACHNMKHPEKGTSGLKARRYT